MAVSSKVRPVRSGSLRLSRDWSEESEEPSSAEKVEQTWVALPQRWRAVAKFDTTSPFVTQKVVIDVGVTTSYRREGPHKYIIGAEIFDLLWDSNMFANADECRGWFIDELEVQFEPLWSQDEIVTGSLFPKTANAAAHFGNAKQMGITGFIGKNPTLALSMSNTHSQQISQQMYSCKWERGARGVMSFHWNLNHWCPSEYPKAYNPMRWSGSKVPRLPPDYEKGSFNGLDYKPRVEWVVPASVVRAGLAAWRVTVSASLACVGSKKNWIFPVDKYFAQREMQHEEIWRFPIEKDLSTSGRGSSRHSCRSSVALHSLRLR